MSEKAFSIIRQMGIVNHMYLSFRHKEKRDYIKEMKGGGTLVVLYTGDDG